MQSGEIQRCSSTRETREIRQRRARPKARSRAEFQSLKRNNENGKRHLRSDPNHQAARLSEQLTDGNMLFHSLPEDRRSGAMQKGKAQVGIDGDFLHG
ncbi:MAG TPA: hypothetical protein VJW76_08020 [Verrucomicrobiae bacterium]|nr:hypothetical protein [Verrucomicrobiae bacterium]